METVLQLTELFDYSPSPCSGLVVAAILVWIGQYLSTTAKMRAASMSTAAVLFLLYLAHAYQKFQPATGADLLSITLRALPVLGISLGLMLICMPLLAGVYRLIARPMIDQLRSFRRAIQMQAQAWRDKYEEAQRQRQAEETREQWKHERAQRQQIADQEARREAETQSRRNAARASCELLFNHYAHAIEHRFSRAMFDDFLKKHLNDQRSAEEVERWSAKLQAILQQHYTECHEPPKNISTVELAQWYQQQKEQLERLPLDDKIKNVHLVNLNRRFQEIMTRHLEESQP